MQYKDFVSSFRKAGVEQTVRCFSHLIEKMETGEIIIDGNKTEYNTIEEARYSIKQNYISKQLEEQVSKELYEEISDNKIASIIKEHHDIKVTDTLIESYIQLASSHIFSVDPVVQEIRKLNKLDNLVENKIHYVLNDDSIVAISESTQDKLNNILQEQTEIIEYMRESKENFFHALEKLEE